MDRILIKGLRVFAFHGVNPEEKENGQNFELDVTLHTSLKKAGQTDNIDDTVSYSKVTKVILREMKARSYDLLEKAATMVAQAIFAEFPPVERVDVLLKKPEAPMSAEFDFMAVEISRTRGEFFERGGN